MMSSSNLEDLSKRVMRMTFSPSPFPRWVTCHGKGDVFYFNEMDLESNSKSGEDTLVWDYPGGEILGKIDGRMARAIFGPVRRASLADDHGLIQPLSGGTDVMQKLQNSLLKEQGRPPREENNRLANTKESVMSNLLPVEIAQAREARFAEGDTAGWEAWMKTQPQTVQDDWQANKEKYGDKFKTAATWGDDEEVPLPNHPVASKILKLFPDAKWIPNYSGRGMMGKISPLALSTSARPESPSGKKILNLGFSWDQLGKGFVYYLISKPKISTAGMLPVEIAQLKTSKFSEGDTAGFEKWMKTQPKEVQDDWAANKEKYGDQFKNASLEFVPDGTGHVVWDDR